MKSVRIFSQHWSMVSSTSSQKLSPTALRHLKTIEGIFFTAGMGHRADHFFSALRDRLSQSPDDAMATTNLLRFLEASFNKSSLLGDLDEHAVLLETLLLIFGSSQYFSDALIRDPELFRWLTASDVLNTERSKEDYILAARQSIAPFQSIARKVNALKRFQRREMLRTGVRDLLRIAELAPTTRELSHLADTIVSEAAEMTMEEMRVQYGTVPESDWAIIGLGKLGGEELNYSSDIDLMALYETDGEVAAESGVKMSYGEFFVRFVERLIEMLGGVTEEGYFYRVDLRLRPDGKSGALIRSYASTMSYYESRGELWERQMLIKARPIAGNGAFAARFLNALSPFVYPRTFFSNPIEEISRIKARIESEAHADNIKLRAGGIRDIEFIVQALQLVNGGKTPALRTASTLAALRLLTAHAALSEEEGSRLRDAYIFFRHLEHRLQMLQYAQTHLIPATKRERNKLALRIGMDQDEFEKKLKAHQQDVRRIFNAVFTRDASELSSFDRFLAEKPDSEYARSYVARFRLESAEHAARHLRRLMYGTTLLGKKEYPERTRTLFRKIAEPLLEEIAASVAPDTALAHCERTISASPSPDSMYALCTERTYRKAMVTICAESALLSNRFAVSPALAESVLTGIDGILAERELPSLSTTDVTRWKNQEECKIAVRYLLGDRNERVLFASLSHIAELILSRALASEMKKLKLPPSASFCIVALGKFGGCEIGFGSDLDVLFLCETKKKGDAERCEQLATRVVTALSASTAAGKLYDVDARLRPEGRNAPMAVAREQYRDYLLHRASLWERQSLTRARIVAGNRKFGEAVLGEIREVVFASPLPEGWTKKIYSMRLQTETRSRTSSADYLDIKLGAGGMLDVEFALQAIQLSRGHDAVPSANMYELLDRVSGSGLYSSSTHTLDANFRYYRRLEVALQLGLDLRTHVIPADELHLAHLARLMKSPSPAEFLTHLRTRMMETRAAFDSTLRALA